MRSLSTLGSCVLDGFASDMGSCKIMSIMLKPLLKFNGDLRRTTILRVSVRRPPGYGRALKARDGRRMCLTVRSRARGSQCCHSRAE
ncbi:hypothetical protein BO85DRAFT_255890 [Aspergillus piperis CBS 112811]|uniref:Uncharacterized protein n=1 Tax=Aspergillus piperis CBS 112811 TaxID=1448313 RepID=A0A8G1VNK6_9EURO|nr:hypothetical protein BO85DRAFT_255890 [Aspergillus piperis CBS 112811]RAH59989.1 hypothetical protein BO85DRAFT_255890 [Aspergillus piperis CBS 112811]